MVVPIVLIILAMGLAISSALAPDTNLEPETLGELTAYSMVVSVIVSIIAIVIVFVRKETKPVGYILLGLSIVMLVATNFSGIIAWVLFFVGGISAIRYRQVSVEELKKLDISIDILKERYAKGEITKEEFDKMKEDLA